jgi:hypothetical protein
MFIGMYVPKKTYFYCRRATDSCLQPRWQVYSCFTYTGHSCTDASYLEASVCRHEVQARPIPTSHSLIGRKDVIRRVWRRCLSVCNLYLSLLLLCHLIRLFLDKLMVQSPSWTANSRSPGQEIPCLLRNLTACYHRLSSIWSQLNLPISVMISLNLLIFSHLRLGLSSGRFTSVFSTKTPYRLHSCCSRAFYMPTRLILEFSAHILPVTSVWAVE